MLVSVIIPNYNHEKFLRQRIESVLSQTYRDFEIIILDDCSTDGSRSIIEAYSQNAKVCSIIYNETNSGSGFKQWKKGIELAKGELIWIAESDDWCKNNFLETLVTAFEKNESCVVAFAQSYFVGNSDEIKGHSDHIASHAEYLDGELFFKTRLVYGCTIFNASMAIFKKKYALMLPLEFTDFKLCGDWFFWINIVRHGDVFISNKILNYYRRFDSSLTSKMYSSGGNFIEELKMFQLLKKKNSADTPLINKSIFNRYNSFRKRKNKFSSGEAEQVLKAFYNSFGGFFLFSIFLLNKRAVQLSGKLFFKTKTNLDHFKIFKTRAV